MRPLEKTLAKFESGLYKVIGIDATKQMNWKEYFLGLFLTNMIVIAFVILVLTFQNYLPLSEGDKGGFSFDLAFHTAISFITDTNLQHYAGDQRLSITSQMIAITFTMFIAPASGIATAFAFIRSFIRKNYGLGNFYVDLTRIIITLLLPIAFVSTLILMVIGVPQTLQSTIQTNTLEGIVNHNFTNTQKITIGPVASLESIKELGSNGGGFFGSNSAHPFENPTGISNIYEMFLMLIIPLSFPITYAKLMGKGRGLSILLAMLIGFGTLMIVATTLVSGPSLLETRFGNFGSVLFDTVSLATNTGAVNSALTGMSPNAVISFFLAMFVQAIPGACRNWDDNNDCLCFTNIIHRWPHGWKNTRIYEHENRPQRYKISRIYLSFTSCHYLDTDGNSNGNRKCSSGCRQQDYSNGVYSNTIRIHFSSSKQRFRLLWNFCKHSILELFNCNCDVSRKIFTIRINIGHSRFLYCQR